MDPTFGEVQEMSLRSDSLNAMESTPATGGFCTARWRSLAKVDAVVFRLDESGWKPLLLCVENQLEAASIVDVASRRVARSAMRSASFSTPNEPPDLWQHPGLGPAQDGIRAGRFRVSCGLT